MPMTPQQFISSMERQTPAPVYLFVGPEIWHRGACKQALVARHLGAGPEAVEGLTQVDLDSSSLGEALDEARSMSLFASRRIVWISSAESVLPKGRAAASSDADSAALVSAYCADPNPDCVVVFDSRRWEFEGEDKTKVERLRKFFSAVKVDVEFRRPALDQARLLARDMAASAGLKLGGPEFALLMDSTAGDPSRLHNEIEKLALFARAKGSAVTRDDIFSLVPNSSETTIFALVDALAARDRALSMDLLDRLVREGEYLPLALTFLGGVFRLALTAREENLRGAQAVQSHFQRQGVQMWGKRAEQVYLASSKFSKAKLEEAIRLVFETDSGMKSTRPDDRIVMEDFVFRLTAV